MVRKLLHAGADPNAEDVDGSTALHIVSKTGSRLMTYRDH